MCNTSQLLADSIPAFTEISLNIQTFDQIGDIRSIVLELPPAPAALVLVGRALATLSARSAAAFLLIAVFGPPGGDRFRPLLTPADAGGEAGEDGRGED